MNEPNKQDIADVEQAKSHQLWNDFVNWCEAEDGAEGSIPYTGHPEDWWIWWNCFISGAIAAQQGG